MRFTTIFLIRVECYFLFLNPVCQITGISFIIFLKVERRGGRSGGKKIKLKETRFYKIVVYQTMFIIKKMAMLKFVLTQQQYKKRNRKVLIISICFFGGFRIILCCL